VRTHLRRRVRRSLIATSMLRQQARRTDILATSGLLVGIEGAPTTFRTSSVVSSTLKRRLRLLPLLRARRVRRRVRTAT
jgi:hypothetical protein